MSDNVNNPRHYDKNKIIINPIDLTELFPGNISNALKYSIRCELKGNYIEDLEKAIWYLYREAGRVHEEGGFKPTLYAQALLVVYGEHYPHLKDFAKLVLYSGRVTSGACMSLVTVLESLIALEKEKECTNQSE